MKKQITVILTAALILTAIPAIQPSFAATKTKVDITVNDARLTPDSPAYISATNRTMVPISFISKALKFETTWDDANKAATIKANGKTLVIAMNNPYALVDGQKVEMDPGKGTTALIKDNRTMVPVKFIANTFDVDVVWVAYPVGGGLVKISTKGFVPVVVEPVESATGILTAEQERFVIDGMNASVSSGAGFEDNVNKYNDKQKDYYVNAFMKDFTPPKGVQWLISKNTIHRPGMSCIAGLEIKVENGTKYQRIFNIAVNIENEKLVTVSPFEYRSEWQISN